MRSTVKVVKSGATASSAVGIDKNARLIRMPESAVDALAEQGDHQAGDRHAHGAGIDGKAHRRRRDVVGARQRRKDRLRREQVDDRQKGGQADYDRAQQHPGRVTLHLHLHRFQG